MAAGNWGAPLPYTQAKGVSPGGWFCSFTIQERILCGSSSDHGVRAVWNFSISRSIPKPHETFQRQASVINKHERELEKVESDFLYSILYRYFSLSLRSQALQLPEKIPFLLL